MTFWTASYGQDGSDIRYFKTYGVDSSIVGQYVQFDFFNRSYHGLTIDTVTISIDSRPIRFIEIRRDDGYNNWFSQQGLQSSDKVDGQTIKISKFRLDSITATTFIVTMFVEIYNTDNKLLYGKPRQIQYSFDKKDIIEILVKSKQL